MDKAPMLVPILPPTAFLDFEHWLSPGRHLSPVFTAHFTIAGKEQRMYCKPYRLREDKGLFNEIAGYIVAHSRGLPLPRNACLARIPAAAVPERRQHCRKIYEWVQQTKLIPVFCTSAVQALAIPESMREKDIADWPTLAAAVVLDDSIANTDRHPHNLLRTGKNQYILIDHGILLTETDLSGNWTAADIDGSKHYRNQLADLAAHHHKTAAVIDAAERLPGITPPAWNELQFWAKHLLTEEESELFLNFCRQREESASCLLKTRYNMI